jgi:hypothetical protein
MSDKSIEFSLRMTDPGISPQQLENTILMFRHELKQEWGSIIHDPVPDGTKDIDPAMLAIVVLTIVPTVLTKFLDFLHSWAMRRENHHIKLKIQLPDNASIEIEVPQTSNPEELKEWIEFTRHSLLSSTRRKSKKR